MKILEKLGVKSIPVFSDVGDGYAIYYNDGLKTSACVIASDKEGGLHYSSFSDFTKLTRDDLSALLTDNKTDSRAHAPWAFAMIGGGRIDDLIDELNLPYENRDLIRDELEVLIDEDQGNVSGIDRKSLDAIERSFHQTRGSYEFYSGDSERSVIRRQAAASYPILADLLSANLMAKMAVDQKKPIADAVVKLLSKESHAEITKPVLKRLSAAEAIPNGVRLSSVVRLMTQVPPDWIPSSGQDWRSFCQVAGGIFEDLRAPDDAVPSLIKSAQGKWTDFCQRVIKKAGIEGDNVEIDIRVVMDNTSDMLNDFKDFIVLPLAAHGGNSDDVMVTTEMGIAARDSAFEMLIRGRVLTDVADQQRRFHLGRNGILSGTAQMELEARRELKQSIAVNTWPGLSDPIQAPNGLWLVPLRSTDELQQEGSAMNHCVGGYTRVAENCSSFIVSVRSLDEDGRLLKRHSTIEFAKLDPSNDVLKTVQNRGVGNSAPSNQAKDAENWYRAAVLSGQVKLNRKLISAFLDDIPIPDDAVERLCGYDWKNRDSLNMAVMPWFPYVNKAYQVLDLDGLMDCGDIAPISNMIAPDPLAHNL